MHDEASDATSTSPTDRAASDDRGADRSRDAGADDDGDSTFETWLVRFFLFLVFGVAFGIEGRTLIQTYLGATEDDPTAEVTAPPPETRRVGVGDPLLPDVPAGTVRAMRLTATAREWTFSLTVSPDSLGADTLSLSLDRLSTDRGESFSASSSHTWTPGDTTRLAATWTLPAGQQPSSLRVTARRATPDTTRTTTQIVSLARTPVRMQR